MTSPSPDWKEEEGVCGEGVKGQTAIALAAVALNGSSRVGAQRNLHPEEWLLSSGQQGERTDQILAPRYGGDNVADLCALGTSSAGLSNAIRGTDTRAGGWDTSKVVAGADSSSRTLWIASLGSWWLSGTFPHQRTSAMLGLRTRSATGLPSARGAARGPAARGAA